MTEILDRFVRAYVRWFDTVVLATLEFLVTELWVGAPERKPMRIERVIGKYVPLKETTLTWGKDTPCLRGVCPFCGRNTLIVAPEKNRWICCCVKGGNAEAFLRLYLTERLEVKRLQSRGEM